MKKEIKVVMLPSEKASVGQIYLKPKMGIHNEVSANNHNNGNYDCQPQHLYLLSDDEIKVGDWYLINQYNRGLLLATQPARIEELQYQHKFQCNKIVATTNTLLGLPTLSNEFLQKYCTSGGGRVEVEYTLDKLTKEYVDEQDAYGYDFWTHELKVNDDNTINASFVVDRVYNRVEVIELLHQALSTNPIRNSSEIEGWIKNNLK